VNIIANKRDSQELNNEIRNAEFDVLRIDKCFGQRFIGAGMGKKTITINGTPGNALGAYLDGGTIVVNGNAQDATGDTMNDGKIIINGSAGDALGYAMRGGSIFVRGDSGYRTGIHMKEYRDKIPTIVIGGKVGSFLGEYMAGGVIVVLGLDTDALPVGNFTGTGMHGGKIFIRTERELRNLPSQVTEEIATEAELREIEPLISEFAEHFEIKSESFFEERFYVVKPNAKNPYKQLYTVH
jgi:glutamate synthase domain-containing protein 3